MNETKFENRRHSSVFLSKVKKEYLLFYYNFIGFSKRLTFCFE